MQDFYDEDYQVDDNGFPSDEEIRRNEERNDRLWVWLLIGVFAFVVTIIWLLMDIYL